MEAEVEVEVVVAGVAAVVPVVLEGRLSVELHLHRLHRRHTR